MLPNASQARTTQYAESNTLFLRSINLCYDAEYPERIAHYHPTAKSAACLKALAGFDSDRAFFIVAPYGSGKSIMVTYLLHMVENKQHDINTSHTLLQLAKRLVPVNPELGEFATKRRKQKRFGLVLGMHGYARSLPQALKDAALAAMKRVKLGRQARPLYDMPCDNIEQAIELLTRVKQKARTTGCDRVLILWDEFGRHLESLLAEGRPTALSEIQLLAEFVSRSNDLPMTLGLLLHQDLLRYASTMPQSVRAEWTKIEGRFQTIQYIDDSKEIYRLIATVVESRSLTHLPPSEAMTAAVAACKQFNLFKDFAENELEDLFTRAYPLEPTTLYMLPRLSARVAQNERTLFSFLYATELDRPIGPAQLYDYFSPSMRGDTAVGGTYRQWLETQSALSKVGDDYTAINVLKTACLLGLGTSGDRSRTSRDLLYFAVRGYTNLDGQKAVIEQLVEQKLLLHRRHSDDVSVWHGTDVDLRGRLEEEKYQRREQFKLLDFLSKEVQPPIWRPVEYNDDFYIRRYLAGEYHNLETLTAYLHFELPLKSVPVNCDGKVLYVIAETAEHLREVETIAREQVTIMHGIAAERIVLALPSEPLPLFGAALEVECLLRMQVDGDLVESDPLIIPELQQMTDDARGHLQQLMGRLVCPAPHGPRWFYNGQNLKAENSRDLRKTLSQMMRHVYSATPKINNENIVRHKPTSPLVNARKKLLLGILERSGQENLGIEGNFPDASMFRTVLLNTGLYRQNRQDERWEYALPDDISDLGLRAVWSELHEFFTEPAQEPKELRTFFDRLMEPPYGVRAGLLPILFAAAMKAFPSAIALTKGGAYITDILPSEIEQICREPDAYRLRVLSLSNEQRIYLLGLYNCLSPESTSYTVPENDLIRSCFDALENWKVHLPPAAMVTKQLSERATRFQSVLRQQLDPVHLLINALPAACEFSIEEHDQLLQSIAHCIQELENVAVTYRERAAATIQRVLAFGHDNTDRIVRDIASQWANCFSDEFVMTLSDGIAKGMLSRMKTPYETDEALLESLASLLVGRSIRRWDDSTTAIFDRELRSVVHRVEEATLASDMTLPNQGTAVQGVTDLIQGRMTELYKRLIDLVGIEEAQRTLSTVHQVTQLSTFGKGNNGHHSGRLSES